MELYFIILIISRYLILLFNLSHLFVYCPFMTNI